MLLEIIMVAAVVGFVVYFMMKIYTRKPQIDTALEEDMAEQDIDADNYQETVRSLKEQIETIKQEKLEEFNDIQM